jgi:DNA-binding CsgD family transcriptional regulator
LVPCAIGPGEAVLLLARPRPDAVHRPPEVESFSYERLAQVPGAMALVTNASWQVRSMCPQFARALGYSFNDLIGASLADIVHPDDIGFVVASTATAENSTSPSAALDVRFRNVDDHWSAFASSAAPLHAAGGFDGISVTAFTHSQLHASITRVARLATEIQQVLEDVARVQGTPRTFTRESNLSQLSAREREIVEMVAGGLRVSTIADRLFIAPGTVRNHLSAVFRKFGVSSQAELTELLFGAGRD